jgi:hypothetical protein
MREDVAGVTTADLTSLRPRPSHSINTDADLPGVATPTLLLVGGLDEFVPIDDALPMYRMISQAEHSDGWLPWVLSGQTGSIHIGGSRLLLRHRVASGP